MPTGHRASALATSPAGLAEEMYALLPAVYRRFDEPTLDAADARNGPLHRFLRLPGGQLDRFRSEALSLLDALGTARVDGARLPLLAAWIGWHTDFRREIGEQRNEIRHAPALYRAVGLAPAIEVAVRRVTGQTCLIKEFVDNVARTNRPPRWCLWQSGLETGGAARLLSLDASSSGGRAAAVRDPADRCWLVYASDVDGSSRLRVKRYPAVPGEAGASGWTAGRPLTPPARRADRPTAVLHAGAVRIWWDEYDPATEAWAIRAGTLDGDGILTDEPDLVPPHDDGQPVRLRRAPAAAVDGDEAVWLFWQEWDGRVWRMRGGRHDGSGWQPTRAPVPDDPVLDPDAFVVAHPSDPDRSLWLFWTARDGSRRRVFYRIKRGREPGADDWADVQALPPGSTGDDDREPPADDREPSARVLPGGDLDVLWSSRRGDRLSVWRATLGRADGAWGPAAEVTTGPSAQRAPAVVERIAAEPVLVVRSTADVPRPSRAYSGHTSVDARYRGSATAHASDRAVVARRGRFDDIGTYTHGGSAGPRYRRDTIGIYLPRAPSEDEARRLGQLLQEFLPAGEHAVILVDSKGTT